ncbi:hypothetical protein THIOKS190131 [Thiocapsa sp. KS1]|nr:hypothetical protein THIOKS190131 [Thiocapsa sp. KS1]
MAAKEATARTKINITDPATNPMFSTRDFRSVPPKYRSLVPAYVKDYVPLNQFM